MKLRHDILRFPQGKTRAFTMSYDDGAVFDERMLEVMNKHGIQGSFNICSGSISDPEQIVKRYAGHEVAVHGREHLALARAVGADAVADILHTQTGKLAQLFVVAPVVLALDVYVCNENEEKEDYQCRRNKYYDVALTSDVGTTLCQVGIAPEKSGIVAVAIVHLGKIGHVADTAYGIVVLVYLYTISVCLGIIALLGKILHETLIVKIEICRTNSRIIVRQ